MRKAIWLGAAIGTLASTILARAQSTPEIWHYYAAGSEKAGIEALIEYANKQNPDAQVTGRVIPGNVVELRRQLQTAFMGNQPPRSTRARWPPS